MICFITRNFSNISINRLDNLDYFTCFNQTALFVFTYANTHLLRRSTQSSPGVHSSSFPITEVQILFSLSIIKKNYRH